MTFCYCDLRYRRWWFSVLICCLFSELGHNLWYTGSHTNYVLSCSHTTSYKSFSTSIPPQLVSITRTGSQILIMPDIIITMEQLQQQQVWLLRTFVTFTFGRKCLTFLIRFSLCCGRNLIKLVFYTSTTIARWSLSSTYIINTLQVGMKWWRSEDICVEIRLFFYIKN